MNKGLIALGGGIALMSVAWVLVRSTATESPVVSTDETTITEGSPVPAAGVPSPQAVVDDPVPVPDLGAQSDALQALVGASGTTGDVHRRVADQIDQAGLLMHDRLWLHRKVDQWMTGVEAYREQVDNGEMSAADAATNADEDLEFLSMSLQERTPSVHDAVVSALRDMNP